MEAVGVGVDVAVGVWVGVGVRVGVGVAVAGRPPTRPYTSVFMFHVAKMPPPEVMAPAGSKAACGIEFTRTFVPLTPFLSVGTTAIALRCVVLSISTRRS